MNEEVRFTAGETEHGQRVDKALARYTDGLTRSAVQKLFEQGQVRVDGTQVAKNHKLQMGQAVVAVIPPAQPLKNEAQNIPLSIVYEDEDLLVVNKPKGMVVHPAPGNPDATLVNALLYHCKSSLSGINGVLRPGIVHRIDKETSGLLIVAKNDRAHVGLAEQIKEHSFTRAYEAVVHGVVRQDGGTICQPIGRHPVERKKMAVTQKNAKQAVTHYQVLTRYQKYTHLRLQLETGRTHQIRVHMAYLGYPVAGDPVYGPKKKAPGLQGQCLHAKQIGFRHPRTGEWMEFESELPEYFTTFLSKLRPYGG